MHQTVCLFIVFFYCNRLQQSNVSTNMIKWFFLLQCDKFKDMGAKKITTSSLK